MRADVAAYAQPTPRRLYVHDDLSDHVARRCGAGSPAALLARDLLAAVAREAERVRLLTLGEQVERVVAQGAHAPFAIAIGVGSAGRRVAETLHERAGWFPRIRRVGLTREGLLLAAAEDELECYTTSESRLVHHGRFRLPKPGPAALLTMRGTNCFALIYADGRLVICETPRR